MILYRIDLSVYSFLVLLFLAIDLYRHPIPNLKTRLYQRALYANMFILLIESISWIVDGIPGTHFRLLNYIANSILYAVNLLPLSLWFCYFDESLILVEREKLLRKKIYLSLNLFTFSLVFLNLFTGLLFSIDQNNIFERGLGATLSAGLNYVCYLAYVISILKYRKYLSDKTFPVLLSVAIFPAIGGIIQTKFYGLILVWPMAALVSLLGYILIEREEMNRDTVTQLPTRALLEERMKSKLSKRQTFAIIMLDLDKFKSINDNFGHREGDEALKLISNLLQKSIKQYDQAYRYAGDEFVILLETQNVVSVSLIERRLIKNLNKLNEHLKKNYKLSFSFGSFYYDGTAQESIYHILAEADKAMYLQKNSKS